MSVSTRRSGSFRAPPINPLGSPTGLNVGSTLSRAGGASVGVVGTSAVTPTLSGEGQSLSTPRASFFAPGGAAPRTASGTPPSFPSENEDGIGEEPSGLTPASLKHLRRQRDKLVKEKAQVQADLSTCQGQLKEQKERNVVMESQLKDAQQREATLAEQLERVQAQAEAHRLRAEAAEESNKVLEETIDQQEREIERLREALRNLSAQASTASAMIRAGSLEGQDDLKEKNRNLEAEVARLQKMLKERSMEFEEMKASVAGAVAAAEQAMAMHVSHAREMEQLKAAKLAEAINDRIELHISVPRVSLNYNNAPPMLLSSANGLGDELIKGFLEEEVFPHFTPLWARLDKLDIAPDGSSKREYSGKMLDKLTEAVKAFVKKSQQADEAGRTN